VKANGTKPRRRVARLRVRPYETDPARRVLTASGKPSGLRLLHDGRGVGIVRAPNASAEQRAVLASAAARASGERTLSVHEHDRIRRLALRALSPVERWDRLALEAEADAQLERRAAQRIDVGASNVTTVLSVAEARRLATAPVPTNHGVTASVKPRPRPPRGRFFVRREGNEMLLFKRVRGGGEVEVPRDRAYLAADGRIKRNDFAAEFAALQEQEDEMAQRRDNEAAASGLAAFARTLFTKLDRIGSTPPVVNVQIPPTVVNVPATNVTVPTPQVTVTPNITVASPNVEVTVERPTPRAVRVETDPETGDRLFVPLDEL
jgi:hypothetical protein